MQLSVGILAGGKSTRMGQNKALLKVDNRRFIEKIAEELGGFSEVIISAAQKGFYEDLGFPMVYDEQKEIGPLEGIYQILMAAKEDYVFLCAADMPLIQKELVFYLSEFISSDYDCFCVMDEEHVHPLCAIYSKKITGIVRKQIEEGQYRLMELLEQVRTKYIGLEWSCFDQKIVQNINTMEAYKRLSLPVVFCVSGVKNSGKTGLILKLMKEFQEESYSVGVIKHDGHEYVMDHLGTDTYRYRDAGATRSIIYSNTQYSMNCKGEASIEEMIYLCKDMDIIIIEGLKQSNYPKIEVVRRQISQQSICDPNLLISIASDVVSQDEVKCPVYGLDDVPGIFSCLKHYFGLDVWV